MLDVNELVGFGAASGGALVVTGTAAQATSTNRAIGTNDGLHPGLQFVATVNGVIVEASFDISSVSSAQTWHAELWTNNAGSPGTQIGSDSDGLLVSTSGVRIFTFSSPPAVALGTTYWLVFQPAGSAGDVLIMNCCADQAGYGSGRNNTITSIADNLGVEWKVGVTQLTT